MTGMILCTSENDCISGRTGGLDTSGGITFTANGTLIKCVGTLAVGVGIICTSPEVGLVLLY